MKIDWKLKLSSRKFWAAVALFVSSVLVNFLAPEMVERVVASITAFGSIIVYILVEGNVDAARIEGETMKEVAEKTELSIIETDCDGSDFPKMGF